MLKGHEHHNHPHHHTNTPTHQTTKQPDHATKQPSTSTRPLPPTTTQPSAPTTTTTQPQPPQPPQAVSFRATPKPCSLPLFPCSRSSHLGNVHITLYCPFVSGSLFLCLGVAACLEAFGLFLGFSNVQVHSDQAIWTLVYEPLVRAATCSVSLCCQI